MQENKYFYRILFCADDLIDESFHLRCKVQEPTAIRKVQITRKALLKIQCLQESLHDESILQEALQTLQ